jgi:alpha-L-fucosidase
MFHTRQSSYNIVDGTPFKRDIIKELADECHKEGIKLHFYYSQLDWRRADYFPLEGPAAASVEPNRVIGTLTTGLC